MIKCAIVGATGLVGSTFLKVLEEKKLDNISYTLFASKKSAGKKVNFMWKDLQQFMRLICVLRLCIIFWNLSISVKEVVVYFFLY